MATTRYACRCLTGTYHTHEVPSTVAKQRGIHSSLDSSSLEACSQSFAENMSDALEGSLLGLLIGDALGAPLHWVYTWSEAQRMRASFFPGGKLGVYNGSPPTQHSDSHKYFSRCDPAKEPEASLFGPHASAWHSKGEFYHSSLRPGDNTLSGRLVGELISHLAEEGHLDMDTWWKNHYLPLLTRSGSPPKHDDLWVDECHRVLFRNLAKGAHPFEAGMDDLCLTGIALCIPLLLCYSGNRAVCEKAVQCLCQLTHKNRGMVNQVMWWGDLLGHVLSGSEKSAPAAFPDSSIDIEGAIDAVFESFSEGKVNLKEVCARELTDEEAYHGSPPVFSSR